MKTKEEIEFERTLATRVARLTGYAKPYIDCLSTVDRDYFLSHALRVAWLTRAEFKPEDPEESGLLRWWEKCLQATALTRRTWRLRTFDGWRTVSSEKLGRETV